MTASPMPEKHIAMADQQEACRTLYQLMADHNIGNREGVALHLGRLMGQLVHHGVIEMKDKD
jgi:hypothetical protein